MAPARSINPYSVQTVTSFRGEQRPAKACTPFAAITKFRIEFSAVPQMFLARPRSPLRRAAVSGPSRSGHPSTMGRRVFECLDGRTRLAQRCRTATPRTSRFFQKKQYFPSALQWVIEMEKAILESGHRLSPQHRKDAEAIGVRQLDDVRIIALDKIPLPSDPGLRRRSCVSPLLVRCRQPV